MTAADLLAEAARLVRLAATVPDAKTGIKQSAAGLSQQLEIEECNQRRSVAYAQSRRLNGGDWMCECGWVNNPSWAVCEQCGRTP